MSENKIYFSDFFDIDPSTIDEYGALNISLLNDIPLFIDPFLIFCSERLEYQQLHSEIIRYLIYLRDHAALNKPSRRELQYYYCFPEVKQTYIGFCKNGNSGSGLGLDFGQALYLGLKDIFSNFGTETITKGNHIEKVCLIKDGVGKDNISDFITNLIKPYLLSYTEAFAKEYLKPEQCDVFNVSRVVFDYNFGIWKSHSYYLPKHDNDFVLLTPIDLLVRNDMWINRPDMIKNFTSFAESIPDEILRDRVNVYFCSMLAEKATRQDRELAAELTIQEYPELIDYYIRYQEDRDIDAMVRNISDVTGVQQIFIEQVFHLVKELKKQTDFYRVNSDNSYDEAMKRVLYLKHVIEDCDGYRYFYDGDKPIHRESDLHIMYKLVSYNTVSDANAEVNNGRGPVDFKYSRGRKDSTLVEFKLARTLKKNLEKQVDVYKAANGNPPAIKVIVFFSDEEYEKIIKILNELELTGKTGIVLIDARNNKIQASKA